MFARIAILILSLVLIMPAARFSPAAHAENTLADEFRKTLDDLLDRGKNAIEKGRDALDGQKSAGPMKELEPQRRVPQSREQVNFSFAPLVRQVAPSVVNVYAARRVVQRSPFEGDPFFERFFGGKSPFGRPQERTQQSLGSGVIVSEDGVVITNNHVINGMEEVKIALNDGSEYECDIVLKDEKSDLAVLKVKEPGSKFQPITLGNSDNVEVGDLVLAIGNPFGVGQTVTSGIVSAVARSRVGINDFDFFIQTDAAINPGNSGGALIDMQGRLIGINTAIYSRSGGSNGIGFAIPANMAKVVIRSGLSGSASVERPWIGADFQDVTADIAESLGMRRPQGVLVSTVYPDGPAERAGLKPGDVLLGVNNNIITNVDALGYRLDTLGIGNTAEITVISSRKRKTVKIKLEKAPETVPRKQTRLDDKTVLGGATVANLSPAVAQELGMSPNANGVVVLDVDRRSRAAANAVRPGDVVRAINGNEVKDVSDLEQMTGKDSRRGWQVQLQRGNRLIVFERNGNFFRQYVQ